MSGWQRAHLAVTALLVGAVAVLAVVCVSLRSDVQALKTKPATAVSTTDRRLDALCKVLSRTDWDAYHACQP